MKLLRTIIVFDVGNVSKSEAWQEAHASYKRAIESICHPPGQSALTIRKMIRGRKATKDRLAVKEQRNGVTFLKNSFFENITTKERWEPEAAPNVEQLAKQAGSAVRLYYPTPADDKPHVEQESSRLGGFDFLSERADGFHVALEWETGNISSSHRSLLKLVMAIRSGTVTAGVLVVPSRALYRHLTDRIGNIMELAPYIPIYSTMGDAVDDVVDRGMLAISVVEHDELSDDATIPFLLMGKDGNAEKD